MSVVVRRISPGDGAALAATRLAALSDTPSAFGSSYAREVDRTADDWSRRAERSSTGDGSAFFLAWNDDRAVGIVGAYRPDVSESEVELISMWTAPDARRAGVARLLVGAVVGWASATGAKAVRLWVTEGNGPARSLYESMGFDATGEEQPLPSDPGMTEIRMRLADVPAARDAER